MQGKALAATDRWSELTEDGMLHLQEVIDACDVGLCLVDRDKRALIWNPWLADYLDSPYEMKQRPSIEALIPALQGPRFDSMVHQAIAQSQDKGRSVRKKQSTLPRHLFSLENGQFLRVSVRPMMMHPGFCLVQLNELSTERKPDNSPGLSGLTENTTQAILASVEDAVILVNAQGKVEFVNLAAESMTGFQSKRIAGHSLVEVYQVYDEASQSSQLQTFEQILADDSQQLVLVHREGLTIPIQQTIARLKGSDGQLEGFVLVFKDTSQSRKLAAQLNWQSSHDPITRLYNRAEFVRRVTSCSGSWLH
ncbi:MAG: PAS domain-containing protein [Candidatus Thiodiazotropha sp.]